MHIGDRQIRAIGSQQEPPALVRQPIELVERTAGRRVPNKNLAVLGAADQRSAVS